MTKKGEKGKTDKGKDLKNITEDSPDWIDLVLLTDQDLEKLTIEELNHFYVRPKWFHPSHAKCLTRFHGFSNYNNIVHPRLALYWAENGVLLGRICQNFGITRLGMIIWCRQYPDMNEAWDLARQELEVQKEELLEKHLIDMPNGAKANVRAFEMMLRSENRERWSNISTNNQMVVIDNAPKEEEIAQITEAMRETILQIESRLRLPADQKKEIL